MDKRERNKIAVNKYRESAKGKQSNKAYRDKNKAKKREWDLNNHNKIRIAHWKQQGIITDDWENVYNIYIDTTNCDYCKKEFMNSLDRNLDHDHSIKDNNNIRGILCRVCNTTDVLKGCPPIF
tara:strand:- start:44 stop:412 length:369 start_codon:yes stop_codon:yes gene_type:complete